MTWLDDRSVLSVSGEDVQSFLQNIFTNDIREVKENLQYNLLLTPQGKILHDVFIFMRDGVYFIDVETARLADLQKRLAMFKLRAKVDINTVELSAHAGGVGMQDPRHEKLGRRSYETEKGAVNSAYSDLCISLGIPNGTKTIRYETDFAHDVNLDLLNAISWAKGCFIGQEVAARVHNRGLAKKRLMIVTGENLQPGEDIRQVNSAKTLGLAVLRLDSLPAFAKWPDYLKRP